MSEPIGEVIPAPGSRAVAFLTGYGPTVWRSDD